MQPSCLRSVDRMAGAPSPSFGNGSRSLVMDVHDFHATCDDAIDHGKRRSRYGVDPAVFASNRPAGFWCRQEHQFHQLKLPVCFLFTVSKYICIIFMEPTKATFVLGRKTIFTVFWASKRYQVAVRATHSRSRATKTRLSLFL